MDERFYMHRYKSTSHAAMVAALSMGGLYFYEQIANGETRLDLMLIMLAMAVTKVIAMIWYRKRD